MSQFQAPTLPRVRVPPVRPSDLPEFSDGQLPEDPNLTAEDYEARHADKINQQGGTQRPTFQRLIDQGSLTAAMDAGALTGQAGEIMLRGIKGEQIVNDLFLNYHSQLQVQVPDEFIKFQQASSEEAIRLFVTNPIDVAGFLSLSSLRGMLGQADLVAKDAAIGAGIGAGASALFGGIGAVPGAFAGAAVGMGEITGLLESSGKFTELITAEIEARGGNINSIQSWRSLFEDEEFISSARTEALIFAAPAAVFDTISAATGGLTFGAVRRNLLGKTAADVASKSLIQRAAGRAVASGAELGVQGGLGAAGPLAGQLLTEGRITNTNEALAEFLGEAFGLGGVDVAFGVAGRKAMSMRQRSIAADQSTESRIPPSPSEPSGFEPFDVTAPDTSAFDESSVTTASDEELSRRMEILGVLDKSPEVTSEQSFIEIEFVKRAPAGVDVDQDVLVDISQEQLVSSLPDDELVDFLDDINDALEETAGDEDVFGVGRDIVRQEKALVESEIAKRKEIEDGTAPDQSEISTEVEEAAQVAKPKTEDEVQEVVVEPIPKEVSPAVPQETLAGDLEVLRKRISFENELVEWAQGSQKPLPEDPEEIHLIPKEGRAPHAQALWVSFLSGNTIHPPSLRRGMRQLMRDVDRAIKFKPDISVPTGDPRWQRWFRFETDIDRVLQSTGLSGGVNELLELIENSKLEKDIPASEFPEEAVAEEALATVESTIDDLLEDVEIETDVIDTEAEAAAEADVILEEAAVASEERKKIEFSLAVNNLVEAIFSDEVEFEQSDLSQDRTTPDETFVGGASRSEVEEAKVEAAEIKETAKDSESPEIVALLSKVQNVQKAVPRESRREAWEGSRNKIRDAKPEQFRPTSVEGKGKRLSDKDTLELEVLTDAQNVIDQTDSLIQAAGTSVRSEHIELAASIDQLVSEGNIEDAVQMFARLKEDIMFGKGGLLSSMMSRLKFATAMASEDVTASGKRTKSAFVDTIVLATQLRKVEAVATPDPVTVDVIDVSGAKRETVEPARDLSEGQLLSPDQTELLFQQQILDELGVTAQDVKGNENLTSFVRKARSIRISRSKEGKPIFRLEAKDAERARSVGVSHAAATQEEGKDTQAAFNEVRSVISSLILKSADREGGKPVGTQSRADKAIAALSSLEGMFMRNIRDALNVDKREVTLFANPGAQAAVAIVQIVTNAAALAVVRAVKLGIKLADAVSKVITELKVDQKLKSQVMSMAKKMQDAAVKDGVVDEDALNHVTNEALRQSADIITGKQKTGSTFLESRKKISRGKKTVAEAVKFERERGRLKIKKVKAVLNQKMVDALADKRLRANYVKQAMRLLGKSLSNEVWAKARSNVVLRKAMRLATKNKPLTDATFSEFTDELNNLIEEQRRKNAIDDLVRASRKAEKTKLTGEFLSMINDLTDGVQLSPTALSDKNVEELDKLHKVMIENPERFIRNADIRKLADFQTRKTGDKEDVRSFVDDPNTGLLTDEIEELTEQINDLVKMNEAFKRGLVENRRAAIAESSVDIANEITKQDRSDPGRNKEGGYNATTALGKNMAKLVGVVGGVTRELEYHSLTMAAWVTGSFDSHMVDIFHERIKRDYRAVESGVHDADKILKNIFEQGGVDTNSLEFGKYSTALNGNGKAILAFIKEEHQEATASNAEFLSIDLGEGASMSVTRDEMMALMGHLMDNENFEKTIIGVKQRVVDKEGKTVKDDKGKSKTKLVRRKIRFLRNEGNTTDAIEITPKRLAKIKAFVDKQSEIDGANYNQMVGQIVLFFNTKLKSLIAEWSIKKTGLDITKEGIHYPTRARPDIEADLSSRTIVEKTIGSIKITKSRKPGSTEDFIIKGIIPEFYGHASDSYALNKAEAGLSYAESVLGSQHVQNAMLKTRGQKQTTFWRERLQAVASELIGPNFTYGRLAGVHKLLRNFVISKLGLNPVVAGYQLASALLSTFTVPKQYVARAIRDRAMFSASVSREIDTYSGPLSRRKFRSPLGRVSDTGRSNASILGRSTEGRKRMFLITMMDNMVIQVIWSASKMNAVQKLGENADPTDIMRLTAQLAEDAVDYSQPTGNPIFQSGLSIKGRFNELPSFLGMFRSQRYKIVNMNAMAFIEHGQMSKDIEKNVSYDVETKKRMKAANTAAFAKRLFILHIGQSLIIASIAEIARQAFGKGLIDEWWEGEEEAVDVILDISKSFAGNALYATITNYFGLGLIGGGAIVANAVNDDRKIYEHDTAPALGPVTGTLTSAYRIGQSVVENEGLPDLRTTKRLLEEISSALGIPLKPMTISEDVWENWIQDEDAAKRSNSRKGSGNLSPTR